MGVKIYYIIVAISILLGLMIPQEGSSKKRYVIIIALIHIFVCGFRYQYLTGDLIKYHSFFEKVQSYGWMSPQVFHDGKNFGFYWLLKLISVVFGDNYQAVLIVIAIITEVGVANVVYRYSSKPWMSYMLWNCLGLFSFGFSAIKQALAMGLLMFAFIGVMERKPVCFLLFTALAGCIHLPALIFFPAYWATSKKINIMTIIMYIFGIVLVYIYRAQIATFLADLYYDEGETYETVSGVGGRFLMMVLLLILGIVLAGFKTRRFSGLLSLMVISTAIQMFANYDNIYTRLADYYFQFSILYVPAIFYGLDGTSDLESKALIKISPQLRTVIVAFVVIFSIWFYQWSILSYSGPKVDDYTYFRFMWDVASQ